MSALARAIRDAREAMKPCGQYRPDYRIEWWLCDSCGHETESKAYRDDAEMWEHVVTHLPALTDQEAPR